MAEQTLIFPGVHHFTLEFDGDDLGPFQGRWDLPHGLMTQTYGIKGVKSALLDWAPGNSDGEDLLKDILEEAGFSWGSADYLIFTGSLSVWAEALIRAHPQAGVIIPPWEKAAVLKLGIPESRLQTMADGGHLDLGEGKILRFILPEKAPPKTVMVWEESSGTLFTGSLFSSFGGADGKVFYEDLSPQEKTFMEGEAFRTFSALHLDSSESLPPLLDHLRTAAWPVHALAPGFGPLRRSDLAELYRTWEDWLGYTRGETEPEVVLTVLPGCPEELVQELTGGVLAEGTDLRIFRMPEDTPELQKPWILRSGGIILAGEPSAEPALNWAREMGKENWGGRKLLVTGPAPFLAALLPRWNITLPDGIDPRQAAVRLSKAVLKGE